MHVPQVDRETKHKDSLDFLRTCFEGKVSEQEIKSVFESCENELEPAYQRLYAQAQAPRQVVAAPTSVKQQKRKRRDMEDEQMSSSPATSVAQSPKKPADESVDLDKAKRQLSVALISQLQKCQTEDQGIALVQ